MNEDALNMQIRKFLKKTGITSQRSIEQAVREGLENGSVKVGDLIDATMTLSVGQLNLHVNIVDSIRIEE
jgi:hypothetical protein